MNDGFFYSFFWNQITSMAQRDYVCVWFITTGIRFFAKRRWLCRAFSFGRSAKKALPRAK
jgi:hypothetical protein